MTGIKPLPDRAAARRSGSLGLLQSTALVMGSIIGVGVFSLPYSLASFGPISLAAMAITTVGALALALLFAATSHRLPAGGGPYAYARSAFGNTVGFANAWSYWITAWAGNAAIAVGWVFYVETFVNVDGATGWSIVIALVGLWVPAAINLLGLRSMGAFQVVTTVLKFLPLLLMATVGLFFVTSAHFTPWNTSGQTDPSAIGAAMAICLFSYLGVETAAVAAAKVRHPERNVARATVWGTAASAAVYLLSMTAVFGIVGSGALALDKNKASYSVAADTITGGSWAGTLVAVAVVVSGIGALNGWTMICAEMPLAAARDELFPARFARLSTRQVPAFGIVSSTALASAAVVISYLGATGSTVFTTLVLMTGITSAIPFAFSALAQITWRIHDPDTGHTGRLVRDLTIAAVALLFSLAFVYYSRNAGNDPFVVWGPFLMAGAAAVLGVPVYLSHRATMTAPVPVPPLPDGDR